MKKPEKKRRTYWQLTQRLSLLLMLIWFLVTFISIWFARELSTLTLFGWPVSFYLAAQGAALIYIAIVGIYAWRMRQFDKQFKVEKRHGD